jgi:phosphoribosyl 1,2-cyclic phosphodiesterase
MRFRSLGSGSGGNATVVEARGGTTVTRVLIDCGFSARELERRLARAGLLLADLHAVFVTHEHCDHVGCALTLARRHRLPLWASRGTWQALGEPALDAGLLNVATDAVEIDIGDLRLTPFDVPHDAREPLQLRLSDGQRHLGVLTDAGSATPHLLDQLQGCDALLLECNHDAGLLATSSYPASLRRRIAGPRGHLDNDTAASILQACRHPGLGHLVAAHLSAQNNRPELARAALASAWGSAPQEVDVADPALGTDWVTID